MNENKKWLDKMTKSDKEVDALLDSFIDIAKSVVNDLNDKNKDALKDGRKLLIDSPVKTECQCKNDKEYKLNVKNALNANDLKNTTKSCDKNDTKVLDNHYAEALLESIFDLIADVNDDGDNSMVVDLLEEWDYLFDDEIESDEQLERIIDIIYSYLTEKGFEVDAELITENEEDDSYVTAYMEICW